jgi:hypothetical protein
MDGWMDGWMVTLDDHNQAKDPNRFKMKAAIPHDPLQTEECLMRNKYPYHQLSNSSKLTSPSPSASMALSTAP